MKQRRVYVSILSLALVACGPPDADKAVTVVTPAQPASVPITPAPASGPSPEPPALVAQAPAQGAVETAAAPAAASTGPLYYCVTGPANEPQRTPIAFAPSVDALCRKAPEMGPCKYERDACRSRGGKIMTVAGVEITLQTEAEYDRRVLRIRMKSN